VAVDSSNWLYHRQRLLHCCTVHSKVNRKIEISTLWRIATYQNFILKFRTRDCVGDVTPHANFKADRFGGGSAQIRETDSCLWLFYCSYFLNLYPATCQTARGTGAHTQWLRRRVSVQGDAFRGKCVLTSAPKIIGISSLNAKIENRSNSETTNPTNSKFKRQVKTSNYTSLAVYHFPTPNATWLLTAILKIAMTDADSPIWMKFGRPTQNHMLMTMKWSQ